MWSSARISEIARDSESVSSEEEKETVRLRPRCEGYKKWLPEELVPPSGLLFMLTWIGCGVIFALVFFPPVRARFRSRSLSRVRQFGGIMHWRSMSGSSFYKFVVIVR